MAGRPFPKVQSIWLAVIALSGIALLAIGGWQVVAGQGGRERATLTIVGALLAASPFLLSRLSAVSFGTKGFELRLTEQIAEQGAPKTARLLDHTELGRLVDAYGVIREELRDPSYEAARVHVQDLLVSRAAGFAGQYEFDRGEVTRLFPVAAPVVRVMLIGLMKGDPRLLDVSVLKSAIQAPATPNEGYHALVVTRWYWARFTSAERASIVSSIKAADITDPDRRAKADEILQLWPGSPQRKRPWWRRSS